MCLHGARRVFPSPGPSTSVALTVVEAAIPLGLFPYSPTYIQNHVLNIACPVQLTCFWNGYLRILSLSFLSCLSCYCLLLFPGFLYCKCFLVRNLCVLQYYRSLIARRAIVGRHQSNSELISATTCPGDKTAVTMFPHD